MFQLFLFAKRIGLIPKNLSWIIDAEEYFIMEYNLRKRNVYIRSKPKIPVQVKILNKSKLPNKLLTIQNLEKTDLCCFAEYRNQIIHYTFATFKIWNYSEYKSIKFYCKPKTAYLFNSFTEKGFRRMHIASLVYETLLHHLKQMGIERAYVTVRTNNYGALNLDLKIGFKPVGIIKFFKLLSFATYTLNLEQKKEIGLIIAR